MRSHILAFSALLILSSLLPITTLALENKPLVVCTTSVLASIVEDLAGDQVVVEIIASPAVCPGHYDVKPSDIDAFKRASLILAHGFEPWVDDLLQASQSEAAVVYIKGPWNTPSLLKARYQAVSQALSEYLGIDTSAKLEDCLNSIDEVDAYLKEVAQSSGFADMPVVCMLWQKSFIEYLGFKVVAYYGPPEMVSAQQYESIIANATQSGAKLVIDNLQSGVDLGNKIASEIGGVEVALSNFPKIAPELSNVTAVMKWNAEKLSKAVENLELLSEISSLKAQLNTWVTATTVSSIIAVALFIVCLAMYTKLKGRK